MSFDYLKSLDNCMMYCSDLIPPDECVDTVRTEFQDPALCQPTLNTKECEVMSNPSFHRLLTFLTHFFRVFYAVRYQWNTNDYDMFMMLSLGKLDLDDSFQLSLDDLACVQTMAFAKEGIPATLSDYFRAMQTMALIMQEDSAFFLHNVSKDRWLKKYLAFASDFQQWSTLLIACINHHTRLDSVIPSIKHKHAKEYQTFIAPCDPAKLVELLDLMDPDALLAYVRTLSTMDGGRTKRSNTIRRNTRKGSMTKRRRRRRTRRPLQRPKRHKRNG